MEKKKELRQRYAGILLFLAVILVLSRFMKKENTVTYTFTQNGFAVTTASGFSRTVQWNEILSASFETDFDPGEMVNGIDNGKERSGLWQNETGSFTLLTDSSIPAWLVLETASETLAVNFESPASTRQLYEAVLRSIAAETEGEDS